MLFVTVALSNVAEDAMEIVIFVSPSTIGFGITIFSSKITLPYYLHFMGF